MTELVMLSSALSTAWLMLCVGCVSFKSNKVKEN